jgi:hypothetical protein
VQPARQARIETFMGRVSAAWDRRIAGVRSQMAARPQILAGAEAASPGELSATAVPAEMLAAAKADLDPLPLAPSTFEIHVAEGLTPPAGFSSSVNEPAVASSGRFVFFTHNWFAARSTAHGGGNVPWLYMDPYSDMPDFCCDQDVIYDKGRDVFVWERMGIDLIGPSADNRIALSVSSNGGQSYCTYSLFPSGIGYEQAFYDYPRLSLSNDYLYMTANVFNNTLTGFIASVLLRLPLDQLSSCAVVPYLAWAMPEDGWTPAAVENATQVMYLGDNPIVDYPVNSVFRVFSQPEDSAILSWVDRAIAPYTVALRDAVCTVPGGRNPCLRADQRVIGGVLADGQVDFYWNAKEGGDFPMPFVESAGFDERTLTYNARKLVWNSELAWFYAAVGANDRAHVGMSVLAFFSAASGVDPWHCVGIDDNYNGAPPGWELSCPGISTQNWTSDTSGDYLRARTSGPQGVGWVGSGYYRGTGRYVPYFVEWRRGRDLRGLNRFQSR